MSGGVKVRRIQALREMNNALNQFSQEYNVQWREIKGEMERTIEWLADRERYWREEVRRYSQALSEARRALAACQAYRDKDGRGRDCSSLVAQVNEAQRALDQAQKQLNTVIEHKTKVNSCIFAVNGQANRLRRLSNETFSNASAFLRQKVSDLDRYATDSMPSGYQIDSLGGHGSDFQRAKQEMLRRALDDPLVSRDIKGWIRSELRRIEYVQRGDPRVQHPAAINIRMPPGLDAGHRQINLNTAANLRFEDAWVNRTRPRRARELGIDDFIR